MLRWIIWYLQTAFCKHQWEYAEVVHETYHPSANFTATDRRVSATCKKCGWHRNYSKFGRDR
jgi:RNase P subunit RPR2